MIPARRMTSLAHLEPVAPTQAPRRSAAVLALPLLSVGLAAGAALELGSVSAFIDGLVELPVSSWLTIGRELMADREGLAVRQAAWTDVEEAIAAHSLALAAWEVRDALETAVCLVSRAVQRWSRDERCQFAATHGAADAAALALRASAHVRPDCVRVLCSPFGA